MARGTRDTEAAPLYSRRAKLCAGKVRDGLLNAYEILINREILEVMGFCISLKIENQISPDFSIFNVPKIFLRISFVEIKYNTEC